MKARKLIRRLYDNSEEGCLQVWTRMIEVVTGTQKAVWQVVKNTDFGVRRFCVWPGQTLLTEFPFVVVVQLLSRAHGLQHARFPCPSASPRVCSNWPGYLAAAAKSLQSCPTVRPQRRQPTRLLCPWDSPGKNTGVGCHFLLQCMKVKSESEVAQSCPTLSDPVVWSLPGSSVHGIFRARVLEWGAIAFSEVTLGRSFNIPEPQTSHP